MKNIVLLIFMASIILFVSCDNESVKPSDNVTSVIHEIDEVTDLIVSNAFSVEVYFAEDNSVEVIANENLHNVIDVFVDEGELIIRVQDNVNIKGNSSLKAIVRTPYLEEFAASGAVKLDIVDPILADEVEIVVEGASSFSAEINAVNSDIILTGASNATISGQASSSSLRLDGASVFRGADFKVGFLDANLSGASTADVYVVDELNARLTGASSLLYDGNPTLGDISVEDASTLRSLD